MLMARPSSHDDFQPGSLPAQRPRLPSFSHFLSGVQDVESLALLPALSSSPKESRPTRPHDLLDTANPVGQAKPPSLSLPAPSPSSSIAASQPEDHLPALTRFVFPSGGHSPPKTESHLAPAPPLSGSTQPYQVPDESASSPDASVTRSALPDGCHSKTVVGEDYINGKGICYVYNDGSVCPKAVNGHTVNPKWGTTKAGKPRKRLGQACNTCREKKIRCDPQVPKCTQCQKFGRECKFETGNSSSNSSTSSTSTRSKSIHKRHASSPMSPEHQKDSTAEPHGSSASTETANDQCHPSSHTSRSSLNVEQPSPASKTVSDEGPPPRKRQRVSITAMEKPSARQLPLGSRQTTPPPPEKDQHSSPEFAPTVDPLTVDKGLTLRCVRKYMGLVNNGLFHTLPTSIYSDWSCLDHLRRSGSLGVLYAMMAFGAKVSAHSGSREQCARFSRIAEACFDKPESELLPYDALGMVALSFYVALGGDIGRSTALNTRGTRLCYALGMNSEQGLERLVSKHGPWFGLSVAMTKECMRRLFWFNFYTSCAGKYAKGGPALPLDCDIQLPCDDRSFESGVVPVLPIFRYNQSERSSWVPRSGHGPIAYLAEIAMILGEVIDFQKRASSHKPGDFERFRQRTKIRLAVVDRAVRINFWETRQAGGGGGGLSSSDNDDLHSMIPPTKHHIGLSGIYLFYHLTCLVLNRHVPWRSLSPEYVEQCVKESYSHAMQIMNLLSHLDEPGSMTIPFARTSRGGPLSAIVVIAAIDVLTAAGPISELFEHQESSSDHGLKRMTTIALEILEESCRFWPEHAETQARMLQRRLKLLLSVTHGREQKAFYFDKPLHSLLGIDLDIVYGLPRKVYFTAMGWGDVVKGESDFMELGGQLLK